MKRIILASIIVFPLCLKAQSTITHYDQYGYKTGKAKIEHQQPIQPTFKGDYYESSNPNTDDIIRGLSYKQKIYNKNLNWLLVRFKEVNATRIKLFTDYPSADSFFM